MKYYRRFGEWLFRFASSQENIDRVAKWLCWTVVVLAAFVLATVLFVTLARRR
jgi:hypothetical protein